MATFVHIANARDALHIYRNGLKPRRARFTSAGDVAEVHRVVFCEPVVPNFQATFQWLRELKRGGYRTAVGVQFRIDDGQEVWFGRYGKPHERMTAADAVGRYMSMPDSRGYEVLVPRRVAPREIMRVRDVPQLMGWRFFPESKNTGTTWWPSLKGEIKRRRVIASINRKDSRELRGRE